MKRVNYEKLIASQGPHSRRGKFYRKVLSGEISNQKIEKKKKFPTFEQILSDLKDVQRTGQRIIYDSWAGDIFIADKHLFSVTNYFASKGLEPSLGFEESSAKLKLTPNDVLDQLEKNGVLIEHVDSAPKEREAQVIKVLSEGGWIDRAPLSDGLLLMNKADYPSYIKIDIKTFLALQTSNRIKLKATMRQGHNLFRGRVDTYVIA